MEKRETEMKKAAEFIGALLGWFAVITQFILLLSNREASVGESIVRFFSYFTILTNTLVALFFTIRALHLSGKYAGLFYHRGTPIALTAFILIVGLVYQVALRHIWEPQGLQMITDELLHTVIPLFVLVYWYVYASKQVVTLKEVTPWLLYPAIYAIYILIRGNLSGFYPYPFLNVAEVGMQNALFNILIIFSIALFLMGILVWIGKIRAASLKNR